MEIAALEGTFQLVTYTVEDGAFAAASLPDAVLVSVYRPDSVGEVAARFEMEIPPDKRTTIEIVLPEQREPSTFKFKDSRGYPLSRVEVRVVSLDLETRLTRTLFSNDDGEVTVEGARGMPLRIVAERPKMAPLVETLEAAEKEHTFTMADGRKLRGFVTGRGGREKIEDADVTLYTLAGPEHVKTDPDGSFEVEDLAVGRIRLLTRADGYAQDERVILFEGDPVRTTEIERIDLAPAGAVEGTVVDENEQPIAGARVGLGAVPTYLPVGKLPYGIVQTDADGRFELKGLPEGKVVLEAYSNELGRGRSDEIDVRADRTIRRVVVTIPAQAYTPPKVRAAGSLAVTLAEKSGSVTIVDVPEGGEAEHAGIEPGDRIVTLAGRPVITIEDARERLSGPLAEDVIVEVERAMPSGTPIELRLRVRRESVRR
ncbi:MAG: carboxypeptidase regulatory-like domain-containing protein [Myxococcales bacterium]|nr:carboxypeptidase regulatory-like domain-containing protein [Myxococcales bacterium]